ncbi:MotE family protein [Virgibacillus kimchii]
MAEKMKNRKKKMNPVLWLLFAVIIPAIVVIGILLVILNVAGVNVSGWAKGQAGNIPVLSTLVGGNEESAYDEESGYLEERIAEKDAEIESLNKEIRELETTIERLNQDIVKLENRNEETAVEAIELEEENDTALSISGSFKDMDSEQAALILQNMESDTALYILEAVSNKVRGEILEAMDPETAADLTQLLIER